MIKVENFKAFNMEGAIRGARNPMNSWDKSDSYYSYVEDPITMNTAPFEFFIGENDLDLCKRLRNGGSDDRKYLRQIFVCCDIIAPLYWWKEMDQYKVGTVTDSCSTMHTIHKKIFEVDDFSHEHLTRHALRRIQNDIKELNLWRDVYLNGGEVDGIKYSAKDKDIWYQMIQLLPSSYNQKRTWTGNFENLINIYFARKNHKLGEWHVFCDEIEKLPYAKELIIGEKT